MKTTKKKQIISKALLDVWEWKEEVYNDIKDKTFSEKEKYYKDGLNEAAKLVHGTLIKNADNNYLIV